MARKIYWVKPSAGDWIVTEREVTLSRHVTKPLAVEAGRKVARANEPSQLRVQKEDGTFDFEHTYGQDPYPPVG
jgi:hypothetical protein